MIKPSPVYHFTVPLRTLCQTLSKTLDKPRKIPHLLKID